MISVAHQALTPRTLNELWFLCPKQKTNLKTCWKKQQPNRRTARPFSVLYWNPPSGCLVRRHRARLWLKIAHLIYSTGKKKTAPASFLFLPR
ncbi:enhanced serine sensitivity protein SseB [Escherichia coli MS 60-1]|nr:enhanced serine sensitivity protein SseB [Escherichia coli MS 200-1]EGB80465.1 enhanced serine sensitivity protein SseB [Escherichia coli MS 60-1]